MNKQLFAFITLIGAALIGWTVIQGIHTWFNAFATSWDAQATSQVASSLADMVWFGGLVFVCVVGYGMFVLFNRWAKVSQRSRGGDEQAGYYVIDAELQPPMLEHKPQDRQWHDAEIFADSRTPKD
jgi:hypothetical protein